MAHASTSGHLLIATPAIGDGSFEQSVIYMLHHDPVGALGVIINQPTRLSIADLLPRWEDLATEPAVIFSGGPVEPNGFIGVGRALGDQPETTTRVEGTDLVTVDLESDPALTAAHIDRLRIFRGYAGWGPHQLDTELSSGAWFNVEADQDDLWAGSGANLYEDVLRRQSGDLRWFANAPRDPSNN